MKFNKKEFISFFIKNKGISFFDKSAVSQYSGKPSTIYFNWRTIAEDVNNLDKCADFVIQFVQDNKINPDCFVGVPEGATKLAIILQYKWAKKYEKGKNTNIMPFIRAKVKDHGAIKDRAFLGLPKGKIVLIEDIVCRGKGIKQTLKKLEKAEIVPYAIIVLSDRMQPKYKTRFLKALKKQRIKFYSMSQEKEVAEQAVKLLKPSKQIMNKLREKGKID